MSGNLVLGAGVRGVGLGAGSRGSKATAVYGASIGVRGATAGVAAQRFLVRSSWGCGWGRFSLAARFPLPR